MHSDWWAGHPPLADASKVFSFNFLWLSFSLLVSRVSLLLFIHYFFFFFGGTGDSEIGCVRYNARMRRRPWDVPCKRGAAGNEGLSAAKQGEVVRSLAWDALAQKRWSCS